MPGPTAVLVYGWLGFERILFWEYFAGVPALYKAMGIRTLVPNLSWGDSTAVRSAQLAEQLADEPGPLHLIAHSMGGIDSRRYITHLGGHAKVASLTTLGTPHRGSMLADLVQHKPLLSPFRRLAGLYDLTPSAMARFNADTPDHPDVRYRSYSSARPVADIPWLMRYFAKKLEAADGPNDGQVAATSSPWGEHLGTLHSDHLELTGHDVWLNPFRRRPPFDHLPVFKSIGEWILNFPH